MVAAGTQAARAVSRPHRSPRWLTAEVEAAIAALWQATGGSPIALDAALDQPASTVCKALRPLGLVRPAREPKPAFAHCEQERARELLYLDIKKLAASAAARQGAAGGRVPHAQTRHRWAVHARRRERPPLR